MARALARDHTEAEISDQNRAMIDYAVKLTRSPHSVGSEDIDRLREVGFDDAGVLDICQVVSYYNYVNRLADGLGVELEEFWNEDDLTITRSEFDRASRRRGHDMTQTATSRSVRAPRGSEISCKGWSQEAALRMLMNNLDPEVAENPEELIVYGGTGKAARSWEAFEAIVKTLRALEDDETLLVQSGKPVGVFQTHTHAPRVLIANSNLVGTVGDLGTLPRIGTPRSHDVRADDRRLVDLHWHSGHPSRNVRDVRCHGRPALRWIAQGALDPHRRNGGHGWELSPWRPQ